MAIVAQLRNPFPEADGDFWSEKVKEATKAGGTFRPIDLKMNKGGANIFGNRTHVIETRLINGNFSAILKEREGDEVIANPIVEVEEVKQESTYYQTELAGFNITTN